MTSKTLMIGALKILLLAALVVVFTLACLYLGQNQ